MIHLIRKGMPVGKGRARTVRDASGKTWSYTPAKTAAAEEEWRWLFKIAHYQPFLGDVPLSMTVVAYMSDPMKKLDVDNICKCVLDALSEGMAYSNDRQIVHLEAWKQKGKPRTEVWLTDKIPEVNHD